MGDYTGIRLDGVVKKKFRKSFNDIAMRGAWELSTDTIFKEFGKLYRSIFIPCGALYYMPWDPDDTLFARRYSDETGEWVFQCSLKNYEGEIQAFFNIIPYFMERVVIEYYYEYWDNSIFYTLVEGKVQKCEIGNYTGFRHLME